MESILSRLNIYIIPPVLSLVVCMTLAALSLVKGRLKKENVLFALVCLWASLLSPMFISHHLTDNKAFIMRLERSLHFFYVFLPAVSILFYHEILKIRRRALEIVLFAVSALLAVSTQTDYYISELQTMSWGFMAKGGITLFVFGVYGFGVLLYGIIMSIRRLMAEKNQIERLKIKYILFSLNFSGALTICNIPAMSGIDFYPPGNFMFLPLMIMGYVVLRFQLLDIRSILHVTFIWFVISSLVIVPNIALYIFLKPHMADFDDRVLFVLLVLWFALNYFYLKNIQPLINRLFNRQHYNLRRLEARFIADISILKHVKELLEELDEVLKKGLSVRWLDFYLRVGESAAYENASGNRLEPGQALRERLLGDEMILESDSSEAGLELGSILDGMNARSAVPFVQNDELIGILFLGEKVNLKNFTADELRFIRSIRAGGSISLMNALMYQGISNLKDNLELIVEERTRELQKKNDQMIFELKVAKNVQETILPVTLPDNESLRIAARMIPVMEVSGDFYDVIALDGERVAVALIDVSGHGIPSALLTSLIKAELQTQLKLETRTGAVCNALNANLNDVLSDTGYYFTFFLCVVDLARHTLEYTNCGHVNPVVVSSNRSVKKLTTGGFFIGTPFKANFESTRVKLAEGDRLYLLTDGITEARNSSGALFGEDSFVQAVMETVSLPIREQVDRILDDIEEYRAGSDPRKRDDVTLLVMEIGRPLTLSLKIKEALKHYKEKNYPAAIDILMEAGDSVLGGLHLYLLSKMHLASGDREKALYYAESALDREPGRIDFLYQKGKVQFASGEKESARETFAQVAELDAEYKKVAEYLARLGS